MSRMCGAAPSWVVWCCRPTGAIPLVCGGAAHANVRGYDLAFELRTTSLSPPRIFSASLCAPAVRWQRGIRPCRRRCFWPRRKAWSRLRGFNNGLSLSSVTSSVSELTEASALRGAASGAASGHLGVRTQPLIQTSSRRDAESKVCTHLSVNRAT